MTTMRGLLFAFILLGVLLAGCASSPRDDSSRAPLVVESPTASPIGAQLAAHAAARLGTPYRYGGDGPGAFDCSGLVRFVHAELGIDVPRTTAQQYRSARPVRKDSLQPGDLLFFRLQGPKVAHVAIYLGERRFVHAPQTGRQVEIRSLDEPYFLSRLLRAGRLYPATLAERDGSATGGLSTR